jgi:hypothetical protein
LAERKPIDLSASKTAKVENLECHLNSGLEFNLSALNKSWYPFNLAIPWESIPRRSALVSKLAVNLESSMENPIFSKTREEND